MIFCKFVITFIRHFLIRMVSNMNNTIMFLLMITMFPIFSFILFIPYWTRKTESFGVSIPIEIYYSPSLKTMRKNYTLLMGVISILFLGVFWWIGSTSSHDETFMSMLFGVIITIYVICSFIVYLRFHFAMKKIKAESTWDKDKSQKVVIDTTFQ